MLKDFLKTESEKLGKMTLSQKLEYIISYYKFHILFCYLVIWLVSTVLINIFTHKPTAYYSMLLNSSGVNSISPESLAADFSSYGNIDLLKNNVFIDSSVTLNPYVNSEYSLASQARVSALFSSSDLDSIIADPDVFRHYAINSACEDLRQAISEDLFNILSEKNLLYYMDSKELSEKLTANDYLQSAEESTSSGADNEMTDFIQNSLGVPDMLSREDFKRPVPEEMESAVPVGIILTGSEILNENSLYPETVPILGVMRTSKRKQMTEEFIRYLLGI